MLAEVVDLVFARQGHVARRGDDLDLGGEDLERQVEAHLVVARAGRTVGHGVGADLFGVFDDGDGLENTLRADRNGVGAVAQDVAADHVFDAAIEQYRATAAYVKWEDCGIITVPNMESKGSMSACPKLTEVEALGESL